MEKKKIEVEQKLHTVFKTARVDKNEERESDKVEVDKRHYCTHCGRKRDESYMSISGRAAFGKKKWACADDVKACLEIKSLKEAL